MIVDISLDCVVSQRPLWGTLIRLPRPLSLIIPYPRIVMIVLRWSLYGVVSEGRVLGLFIPLPPAVLQDFTGRKHFVGSGFWPNVFLSAVFGVFHSRYQSTLIPVPPSLKAVVTSRAFPSHFVSWF